ADRIAGAARADGDAGDDLVLDIRADLEGIGAGEGLGGEADLEAARDEREGGERAGAARDADCGGGPAGGGARIDDRDTGDDVAAIALEGRRVDVAVERHLDRVRGAVEREIVG